MKTLSIRGSETKLDIVFELTGIPSN